MAASKTGYDSGDKKHSGGRRIDLEEEDRRIISELQGDMEITSRPFARLAEKAGLAEEEVIERLQRMEEENLLRRLAPLVDQEKCGFASNAMVVWQFSEDEIDRSGEKLAGFDFVSHCYRRPTATDWPYQIFTVVHAGSEEELQNKVKKLASAVEAVRWKVLKSEEKLKKESLRYF